MSPNQRHKARLKGSNHNLDYQTIPEREMLIKYHTYVLSIILMCLILKPLLLLRNVLRDLHAAFVLAWNTILLPPSSRLLSLVSLAFALVHSAAETLPSLIPSLPYCSVPTSSTNTKRSMATESKEIKKLGGTSDPVGLRPSTPETFALAPPTSPILHTNESLCYVRLLLNLMYRSFDLLSGQAKFGYRWHYGSNAPSNQNKQHRSLPEIQILRNRKHQQQNFKRNSNCKEGPAAGPSKSLGLSQSQASPKSRRSNKQHSRQAIILTCNQMQRENEEPEKPAKFNNPPPS
ncbi:hypothetical protein M5K25_003434 [Dendrobium thyrsiflorum]|uniref:Uncharacterized protein n=1 Tax=Dendrobium thyrsiflorum TaxID=117978 RepID=A0ABD0VJF4_DENTH